ncbi:Protection of telomeres protein [Lachnellula suecica]|uniref:Protection of telomeres protein 1 n=1 Tax=Lachnellula suecica TaxID=602035 RepID=A0A8T9BR62_9HELO|nr:Protection of telomeres protein [Lachnellula suecica]
MDSTQDSTPASSEPPLPTGFSTIQQIRDLPEKSKQSNANTFVSVIGFAEDYREPMNTNGTDWKCTFSIKDHSIAHETVGMAISIFWPRKSLPAVSGAGDVVLVRNVKVSVWNKNTALLANKMTTQFHIYILPVSTVPRAMSGGTKASWKSYIAPQGKIALPNALETTYVAWANSHKMEIDLPSETEFQERVARSTNVKDKFSLLKDVENGRYYNILGQVIRVFDGSSSSLTVYLSDYTAHTNFYNQVWVEDSVEDGGDAYGYQQANSNTTSNKWPGPYGKMSIQLTLYDGHAEFVRENVKAKDWVLIKNVQIKFGNMGGCLEGFLRGDPRRSEGSVNVEVLDSSRDQEYIDPKLKAAITRKRDEERKFEAQKKAFKEGPAAGDKRQAGDEEPGKSNSKKRRKERRAAAEAKASKNADLNENIRCSYPDEPIISIPQIIQSRYLNIEGEQHVSPFTVCKYKATVRVVDYFPHRLEDFAVGWRSTEYEMLSDFSGNEDTDREEERRIFKSGKGFAKDAWEWRFALLVEDASTKESKARIWLQVDNHAAQGLLGLEDDATSLRDNKRLVGLLREQLFKLWGDLEEEKSAKLPVEETNEPSSTFSSTASSQPPSRKAGDQPDADDSDAENEHSYGNASARKSAKETALQDRDPNAPFVGASTNQVGDTKLAPKNKAFTCCIKQYGVKVKENDPMKADAGNGERWERKFGLFGTQIM